MLTAQPRFPIREMLVFGFLPSFLKKWVYRLRGYRIGKGVRIGLGTVICGEDVEVGKGADIGFLTIIRGKKIRIGKYVQIGAMTLLDTPHLEIGEGTKINEQVFVGGLQFPDSRFVVGRNCQIMQMSFINPAKSITMGDDTCIGGNGLVFGHTSWLSKFEGYPVNFLPVEIGNRASIGWRVFVVAGAKIGDGAVIGGNSLVNRSIPARCLAVGSPATVVAKPPYFPQAVSEPEKERIFAEILSEMLEFLRGYGWTCGQNEHLITVESKKNNRWIGRRKQWRVWTESGSFRGNPLNDVTGNLDFLVSLRKLSTEARRELERRGIPWADIEAKQRSENGNDIAEEVIQYFRRYGVRFLREET